MIARVLAAALTATVLLAQTPISKETPTPTDPSLEKEIQEEQQPELGELGNPRSSFKLGSAKYLEGKNLVYSLFVDTPDAKWSEKEKQEVLENLKIAEEYIETAARDYRKKVDLVVDFKENPSLTGTGKIYFSVKDGKDYEERLDRQIAKWLDTKVSYEELLEEYKAKGIAMVVFFNHKGTPYAICYDGVDNPQESLIMFADEVPSVYAHELLHLFGAHDLYEDAEYTQEVCEYIQKAYPLEIMYTVKDSMGKLNQTTIENEISPITAYHLGWVNYTEEIDVFPQLSR